VWAAVAQQRQSRKTTTNSREASAKDAAQPSLRGRALRLLSRREFSRLELRNRLRSHAEDAAELESLLDDLAQRGWLSDARYADALVRKRKDSHAHAAIQRELKQAGVSPEVAAAALGTAEPEADFAAALALLRRKFRRAPADEKEKARQVRFLMARGYSLGIALRSVKQSAASDGDETA
jgi:regulatory protein